MNWPLAWRSAGTHASEVTSPGPMSSSSARRTASAISGSIESVQRGPDLGELRLVRGELLAHLFDHLGWFPAGRSFVRKLAAIVADILIELLCLFLQTFPMG